MTTPSSSASTPSPPSEATTTPAPPFEMAGARDSAGLEAEAGPALPPALALGLDEVHRPQAVIQLASTLRNLGEVEESIRMLEAERAEHPESPLDDAAAAFLALALVSAGRAPSGRHPWLSAHSHRTSSSTRARCAPTRRSWHSDPDSAHGEHGPVPVMRSVRFVIRDN